MSGRGWCGNGSRTEMSKGLVMLWDMGKGNMRTKKRRIGEKGKAGGIQDKDKK